MLDWKHTKDELPRLGELVLVLVNRDDQIPEVASLVNYTPRGTMQPKYIWEVITPNSTHYEKFETYTLYAEINLPEDK